MTPYSYYILWNKSLSYNTDFSSNYSSDLQTKPIENPHTTSQTFFSIKKNKLFCKKTIILLNFNLERNVI